MSEGFSIFHSQMAMIDVYVVKCGSEIEKLSFFNMENANSFLFKDLKLRLSDMMISHVHRNLRLLYLEAYRLNAERSLIVFQKCLSRIGQQEAYQMEKDLQRLYERHGSKWVPKLIQDTYLAYGQTILPAYQIPFSRVDHEDFKVPSAREFLHEVYLQCARYFYTRPQLYWQGYPSLTIKENENQIYIGINDAIYGAIRSLFPLKFLISKYEHVEDPTEMEDPTELGETADLPEQP